MQPRTVKFELPSSITMPPVLLLRRARLREPLSATETRSMRMSEERLIRMGKPATSSEFHVCDPDGARLVEPQAVVAVHQAEGVFGRGRFDRLRKRAAVSVDGEIVKADAFPVRAGEDGPAFEIVRRAQDGSPAAGDFQVPGAVRDFQLGMNFDDAGG